MSASSVREKATHGIVRHDGAIVLNGIEVFIGEASYFGHMDEPLPVMHFAESAWPYHNNSIPYPEVIAIWTKKPREFCLPPYAAWEMVSDPETGEILCSIFAQEMPGGPVMECRFPDPKDPVVENIYRAAMRGV